MTATEKGDEGDGLLDRVPEYTDEDRARYNALLQKFGLSSSNEGQARLDLFLLDHRLRVERVAYNRLSQATDALRETTQQTADDLAEATKKSARWLNVATWVLAVATTVLAGATIVLVYVTAHPHSEGAGQSDSQTTATVPAPSSTAIPAPPSIPIPAPPSIPIPAPPSNPDSPSAIPAPAPR